MRRSQMLAIAVLAALFLAAMLSAMTAENQARQYREIPGARPSSAFPLGTDELGRDRLARLCSLLASRWCWPRPLPSPRLCWRRW